MRPIRIGVDARPMHWPGIGRVTAQLLAHLAAADRDNRYVVYHSPEHRERIAPLVGDNFSLVALRARVHTVAEQVVLAHRAVADRLDVIHAPTSLVVPVLAPVPLVVTVHDLLLELRPDYVESRLGRLYVSTLHPLGMRRARRLVAVSEFTRTEIARVHPALAARTRTVVNGISPVFRPAGPCRGENGGHGDCKGDGQGDGQGDDKGALLRRLGVDHRRFVLYVGTLKRHKNVAALVEGFAAVPDSSRRGVMLVLVAAPDPRYPEVPRLVAERGLSGSVRFAEGLGDEELARLYRAADVLAMPSTYEGFGLPVAEAMACATAVAVSDVAVFREVAGEAAAYFDPADPASIAATLEGLLTDAPRREALARAGLERARRFSWARAAREMRELYESAARGGRARGG